MDNDTPQPAYNECPVDPHKAADAAEKCIRCRRRIALDYSHPSGLCEDCAHEDRVEQSEERMSRHAGEYRDEDFPDA